jgi:hypothetical protein
MSLAFHCEVCDGKPRWRLDRRGDAIVSWACDPHLATVCHRLQRDWEITELVISDSVKRREWVGVAARLDEIATDPEP